MKLEGFVARLFGEVDDLHKEAEMLPLPQQMLGREPGKYGTFTRERYVKLLVSTRQVVLATEESIRDGMKYSPALADVIRPETLGGSSRLKEDIAYLDGSTEPMPVAVSFAEYIRNVGSSVPIALLGQLWVFEGAIAGGGPALVAGIQKQLQLADGGTAYFRGQGQDTRRIFGELCGRMNAHVQGQFAEPVIESARETFTRIISLYRAIGN